MSISAQSAASVPPVPELIVTRASRASYSPDSNVRTSSVSTSEVSAGRSASASSTSAGSSRSTAAWAFSIRLRIDSTRCRSVRR